jgi:hypothetical protein
MERQGVKKSDGGAKSNSPSKKSIDEDAEVQTHPKIIVHAYMEPIYLDQVVHK